MNSSLVIARNRIMQEHGIPEAVLGSKGNLAISRARQKLCYLLRHLPGTPTWMEIATVISSPHHTRASTGARRYADREGLPLFHEMAGRRPKANLNPTTFKERPMFDDGDEG